MLKDPKTYYWDDEPAQERPLASNVVNRQVGHAMAHRSRHRRTPRNSHGYAGLGGIVTFTVGALFLGAWALHTFAQRFGG